MPTRRTFLTLTAISSSVLLAGCNGLQDTRNTPDDTPTETPAGGTDNNGNFGTPSDEDINILNPEPVSAGQFSEWEPNTNCNDGEKEGMYNSEISVSQVNAVIEDKYKPVHYTDLPDDEKRIIAIMLERGGYATCDVSDAFQSFMERAITQHARKQEGDDHIVWLKYENQYYRLNIRQQDQVYAY